MPEYQPKATTFRQKLGLAVLKNGIRHSGMDVDAGKITENQARENIVPFRLIAIALGTPEEDIEYYLNNGIPGPYILSRSNLLE